MPDDFPAAFAALREILRKHLDVLVVKCDRPTDFSLFTRATGPNGRPMWFAAVQSKKSAVMFHLMPLYFNPNLQAAVDPALLPRQQGKACFNFRRPDAALFARLDKLTRTARAMWEKLGFLDAVAITPERLQNALSAAGVDTRALAMTRKTKAAQAAKKRAATIRKKSARAKR